MAPKYILRILFACDERIDKTLKGRRKAIGSFIV